MESPRPLPPAVELDLHEPVVELFKHRMTLCTWDVYAGIPLMKFPEDLRVYEHIMWLESVEVVLELGTQHGGSALWFRDRLRTLASYGRIRDPWVVSVDLDVSTARTELSAVDPNYADQITLVQGDVLDPSLTESVRRLIGTDRSCLVVEDLAHTYDTTMASLCAFSPLVSEGAFFIVEDGSVDVEEMRAHPDWPRGVIPAIHDWLATPEGQGFRQRRDLELYGMSCHPEGFLQRTPG